MRDSKRSVFYFFIALICLVLARAQHYHGLKIPFTIPYLTYVIGFGAIFFAVVALLAILRSPQSASGEVGSHEPSTRNDEPALRPRTWDDLTPEQKAATRHALWQQQRGRDPFGH
jgi:hypothetical protein